MNGNHKQKAFHDISFDKIL